MLTFLECKGHLIEGKWNFILSYSRKRPFCGQIHKQGLGTDLLAGETKDLLLEAVRCSTSEFPWISLIGAFTTEIKYEHLCKAKHCFLCSENSAAFVTFSSLFNEAPCALFVRTAAALGMLSQLWDCITCTCLPFTGKTFLNIPLLSGRFEPIKCFLEWIVYSPKIMWIWPNLLGSFELVFKWGGEKRILLFYHLEKKVSPTGLWRSRWQLANTTGKVSWLLPLEWTSQCPSVQ